MLRKVLPSPRPFGGPCLLVRSVPGAQYATSALRPSQQVLLQSDAVGRAFTQTQDGVYLFRIPGRGAERACLPGEQRRPGDLPQGLPAATKCGVMDRWPSATSSQRPVSPQTGSQILSPSWDIRPPSATSQSAAERRSTLESEPLQNFRADVAGKPQRTFGLHLCRREKYSHKTTSCDGPRGSLLRVTHTLVAPGPQAHTDTHSKTQRL